MSRVITQNTSDAPKQVSEVKTAVIGIVGTANPQGFVPANFKTDEPIVLLNPDNIESVVGKQADGYSLPKYLPKLYEQFQGDEIPVVIVYNKLALTDVAAAEFTKDENDEIDLEKENICGVVVTNVAGDVTYVEDTDYSVDYATGIVTIINELLTTVKIAYKYGNIASVDGELIAGVSTPSKTGVYALLNAEGITGYKPKIIGAPGYAHDKDVADALTTVGNRLKARFYIDPDTATDDTVSETIAARGTTEKAFGIHEKRGTVLFPELKKNDVNYAPSIAAMGVRARTDMDTSKGYHWPISSQKIYGFDGLSLPVEYSLTAATAESQLLNAAGVVTFKNVSGLKFAGNVNSSYDTNNDGNTDHERFETTVTIGDVIEESIEGYSEQRIDQPITSQWIRGLVRDVNAFLRRLKAAGKIAGGKCWYDPDKNDPTNLAAGQIKFNYDDAATPPADQITYERAYNVDYLANLGG